MQFNSLSSTFTNHNLLMAQQISSHIKINLEIHLMAVYDRQINSIYDCYYYTDWQPRLVGTDIATAAGSLQGRLKVNGSKDWPWHFQTWKADWKTWRSIGKERKHLRRSTAFISYVLSYSTVSLGVLGRRPPDIGFLLDVTSFKDIRQIKASKVRTRGNVKWY